MQCPRCDHAKFTLVGGERIESRAAGLRDTTRRSWWEQGDMSRIATAVRCSGRVWEAGIDGNEKLARGCRRGNRQIGGYLFAVVGRGLGFSIAERLRVGA